MTLFKPVVSEVAERVIRDDETELFFPSSKRQYPLEKGGSRGILTRPIEIPAEDRTNGRLKIPHVIFSPVIIIYKPRVNLFLEIFELLGRLKEIHKSGTVLQH